LVHFSAPLRLYGKTLPKPEFKSTASGQWQRREGRWNEHRKPQVSFGSFWVERGCGVRDDEAGEHYEKEVGGLEYAYDHEREGRESECVD